MKQNIIFIVGILLVLSSWFDLRGTMLGNRAVGTDIKAMIEARTSDRWTRQDHDRWATQRDATIEAMRRRIEALEKR